MSGPRSHTAPVVQRRAGPARTIAFTGQGYGVDPCPGCGEIPKPGDARVTTEGDWWVWHEVCHDLEVLL